MPDIKVVIGAPDGKSYQKVVPEQAAKKLMGMKIGDIVKGEIMDMAGYEFQVTGGSDSAGFPMRRDVAGVGRKKILAIRGVGLRSLGKGIKQRKTVSGNTISSRTNQVNLKMIKEGKEKLSPPEQKAEGDAQ
ncbi:MAG TPA: S6e family ribosomal protein [Candidatus Nanoarchaeia archaeon]|nr:S6e family ribosomal protein [Candidatus Nanoarchaeia archaeon]